MCFIIISHVFSISMNFTGNIQRLNYLGLKVYASICKCYHVETSEQGSVQSMMNCDSEDNMVHQGIFVG